MLGLAPYRVAVVDGERKTVRLWDGTNKKGLSTWVHELLFDELGQVNVHGELKRSRIAKLAHNDTFELICGIIQTGVNGYTSELVDTNTGLVNHQRKIEEAEFIPFFFMLVCPFGTDFGVMLLQRFGNLGAKDFLIEPLIEKFRDGHQPSQLRINRLVPIDLAKQLLEEANIKTIRLIKYEDAGDASSALGEGFSERTNSVEMVFKAKRNGILPTPDGLITAIQGKKSIKSVFAIEGFDYDSIKVEVEIGGRRRVVDIRRPDILSPNVDVTEELTEGLDGHPTWESLVEVFFDFAAQTIASEGHALNINPELIEFEEAEELPVNNNVVPQQVVQNA